MISNSSKYYCEDITKVENYDKAINDTTQLYEVHHRLEIMPFSGKRVDKNYLKDQNMYYHVQPEALIFLTKEEHRKLHFLGKRFQDHTYIKGNKHHERKSINRKHKEKVYKFSEESRKHMSNSHKGKKFPNRGNAWKIENGKRVWYWK